MLRFVVRRVAQLVLTLIATVTVVFFFARLSGNPADVILPQTATPAERAEYIARFGFDQPLYVQYLRYLQGIVTFDFGDSLRYRRPVMEIILPRLFNSAQLTLLAMVLALALAIPLGVAAARWRQSFIDRVSVTVSVLGQAMPSFVVGIVLILVFAVQLPVLPAGGMNSAASFVLPAFTLALFVLAGIVRLLRSSMLETLESDFVAFGRAKGLSEAMITWKHALRNASIPVTTYIGLVFGTILTGAITVEVVFDWPGIGQLTYDSILARDYPLTQAAITVAAAMVISINTLVDIIYRALDPRVRV